MALARPPFHRRLSVRIGFWLTLTVGSALAAHLWLVVSARRVENARAQDGRRLAQLFRAMTSYELGREGHERLEEHFQAFHADTLLRDLRLVGASGRTMASLRPADVGEPYRPGEVLRDLGMEENETGRVETAVRRRPGEEERLAARSPVVAGPACTRCHAGRAGQVMGWVTVELSLREIDRAVTRSRARLLEIGLAVISIALAGIVVMIRRLLGKPLDRLLQTMARVEAGDLTARVAPVSSDELGLLAERFNRMADRLLEITDHQEEIIRERTEKLRGAEIHAMQQEKLASLGVLSAGVAHEIGNPLAAISAVTQLLRRRDQEPERIEKLDLILAHISRISSIVRRLGELARIQPVERSPVDLGEVIETTLTLARFDPRSKSIQVVTELAPGLPPILGVAPRLLEVFLNISLNAFDAMPVGGRLTVRARPARSGVEVEFEDTGAGMTDEVRARIFEPFFTTKPVGAGTGLGLAVSHRVVEDHGGTLEVESAPGRGTRFAVWLPGGAGTEAAP